MIFLLLFILSFSSYLISYEFAYIANKPSSSFMRPAVNYYARQPAIINTLLRQHYQQQNLPPKNTTAPKPKQPALNPTQQADSNLTNQGFNQAGLKLLKNNQATQDFNYVTHNDHQKNQLAKIINQVNEIGEFDQHYPDIHDVSTLATDFTLSANRANQQNFVTVSETLLSIGNQFLALGKGMTKSAIRNLTALYNPQTYVDLGHLITQVSAGIGNALYNLAELSVAMDFNDQPTILKLSNNLDQRCDQLYQFYDNIKQAYHDASKEQVCEITGGLITDAIFIAFGPKKINSTLKQVLPVLPQYQSQISNRLGLIGQEINESVGRLCAKSRKYFKKELLAGEATILGNTEQLFEKASNILKQDSQIISSGNDTAKIAKIVEFENGVALLAKKYDHHILHDAKQALRIRDYKILKTGPQELISELEETCVSIEKVIKSKPHRANFIYDVAQGNKVTENSIREALAACAAEDQGICKQLTRAVEAEHDFTDILGNKWDVKQLHSIGLEANYEKTMKNLIDTIKKDISQGEFILLNVSNANKNHIEIFEKLMINSLSSNEKSYVKMVKYNPN